MSQRIDIGIPESLEINGTYKFEKSYLDDTGEFVIAKYAGTSSVVIGNIKSKTTSVIKSPSCSDINHFTVCCPLLFTLTDNFIQAINITSCTFEQFFQDSFLNADIKYILTNSKYLIGVGIKRLIVWKRDCLSEPPKVIKMTPLQDALGCGQIGSISQSTSFMDESRVIIVNRNPSACFFQVWDIDEASLVCWAKHPSRIDGKDLFDSIKACVKSGIVVGASKGKMYIWDMNNRVEAEGDKQLLLCDPKYVLFEDSVVTAIHVDKSFIIAGSNNGCITMLTTSGREIYQLRNTSSSTAPSDTSLSKSKIVKISRAGRWVVASDNNCHMYLYDIFTPEQTAPPEFVAHSNGSIRAFNVSKGKITVLSHPNKETKSGFKGPKNRPDISFWIPSQIKDTPFGSAFDSPIELLSRALAKSCTSEAASSAPLSEYVDKFRMIIKFLDEAAENEVKYGKNIPFLLIQHAQKALDDFEELIFTTEKIGKVKNKEKVPLAAKTFFRAVSTISEILCMHEAPFKVDNYFAYSDSLSSESDFAKRKGTDGEEDDGGSKKEPLQRSLRRWSKSEIRLNPGVFLSKSGLHVRQRAIKDDSKQNSEKDDSDTSTQNVIGMDEMLEDLDNTFSDMHAKVSEVITSFDIICSEGTFDREKVVPLMNVYSSLHQFDEDFKEMGKDIAMLRGGENYSSDCSDSVPWYGNGGIYSDELMDSSLPAYSGSSVDSEGSSSSVSTN